MSLSVKQYLSILLLLPQSEVELRTSQTWHLGQVCSKIVIMILIFAWKFHSMLSVLKRIVQYVVGCIYSLQTLFQIM